VGVRKLPVEPSDGVPDAGSVFEKSNTVVKSNTVAESNTANGVRP
jgi:hypothetical protein